MRIITAMGTRTIITAMTAGWATHGEDGVELEQHRDGEDEEEDGDGEDVLLGGVG